MTQTWTHKVVKTQRGAQGQWFRYAGRGYASLGEAVAAAESFAAEQIEAGVSDTRILVIERRGGRCVAEYKVGC